MIENNVIDFPKFNPRVSEQPLTEELAEVYNRDVRLFHIEEVLSFIIPHLLQQIGVAGFRTNDSDPEYGKQIAMMVEAIKSYLFYCHHMNHPLQNVALQLFQENNTGVITYKDKENEGGIELVDGEEETPA